LVPEVQVQHPFKAVMGQHQFLHLSHRKAVVVVALIQTLQDTQEMRLKLQAVAEVPEVEVVITV
jgi:hypothetical protein